MNFLPPKIRPVVRWLAGGTVLCWLLTAPSLAADESVDYASQIKPLLQARCYACHGVLKQEGGLRLDTAASLQRGGDSGPAAMAGDVAGSLIVDRVSAADESERMPPEGEPLTAAQVELLKRWIAAGIAAPADEQPERDPRDHWSFRTPVRPPVPAVVHQDWVRNPIDAFLVAELETRQLTPQRLADRRTWLRRVYLDLTGLPPTLAAQDAFLADSSPEAIENVVDRLLDSPQYGERWGRHFMDIWRYSDWWGLGAEVRNSQKHIWHWRDWIIESLNADVGYDQMVREMLAADELYPNDLNRLRATGYLARQYFKFNRTSWLDETIEHTAKGFLGLTFNCCKCHDHKYDPFSQREYYQLRAFFEPYQVRTEMVPGAVDFERDGIPRAFDCNLEAVTFLHLRGDDRNPDKSQPIPPALPEFLSRGGLAIEPIELPAEATEPGLRDFVVGNYLQSAEAEISAARKALEQVQKKTQDPHDPARTVAEKRLKAAELVPPSIRARAAAQAAASGGQDAEPRHKLAVAAAAAEYAAAVAQSEFEVARAEVELASAEQSKKAAAEKKLAAARTALEKITPPGDSDKFTPLRGALKTLESNLETEESRSKPFPAASTGRRAALANWIASNNNPLTARVVVNHVWMRHMNRPLVPTVFDLGRKGTPPTHPALLDWLAVEMMENGWSLKHLHRLIVTSRVYQLSSSNRWEDVDQGQPTPPSVDPENHWYWRMNPGRMEAQVVRDSLLSLSGDLDETMGGPSIPAKDENSRRRSLYFVHSNNEQHKFLTMFDDAKVQECYRRAESVVPQQALALENSRLAGSTAEKIVARIQVELDSLPADRDDAPADLEQEFIRRAFLITLSMEPGAEEMELCRRALEDLSRVESKEPLSTSRARTQLVLALLNHNDFVTIR